MSEKREYLASGLFDFKIFEISPEVIRNKIVNSLKLNGLVEKNFEITIKRTSERGDLLDDAEIILLQQKNEEGRVGFNRKKASRLPQGTSLKSKNKINKKKNKRIKK